MDYKTTNLSKDLSELETLFPELNNLQFATLSQGQVVFDATHYIEANELEAIDHRAFSRACKRMVEVIAQRYERATSEMFYTTPNGHVWVTSELVFLFVAFVNPEMLIYFNNIIGDAMTDGVAYSDGFVYDQAATRLPSDIMQDIIKQRIKDGTENK